MRAILESYDSELAATEYSPQLGKRLKEAEDILQKTQSHYVEMEVSSHVLPSVFILNFFLPSFSSFGTESKWRANTVALRIVSRACHAEFIINQIGKMNSRCSTVPPAGHQNVSQSDEKKAHLLISLRSGFPPTFHPNKNTSKPSREIFCKLEG